MTAGGLVEGSSMYGERQTARRFVIASSIWMLLLMAAPSPAAGPPPRIDGGGIINIQAGAPPKEVGRRVHRLMRRAENTATRLRALFSTAGAVWISILASGLVFLLVAAVSSAVDFRMLAMRRNGPGVLSRYLGHGTLTFFRIVRDRRTPNLARVVLVAGLVYWLLPTDLIPDESMVPGFVDDLVVAITAAKVFIYLCPEALVARHAAAVEAHA